MLQAEMDGSRRRLQDSRRRPFRGDGGNARNAILKTFILLGSVSAALAVALGAFAAHALKERLPAEMLGVFDRLAYSHAQELANGLMQDFLADEVDEVQLMYNEFRSVAVQRPVRRQLLPLGASGAGEDEAADGLQEEYLYEPSPEAILASLLPRHVTTQVYRALMESAAGEFGARMTAMESASKNAREMINLLTIQYNKARQERITKELLDIVGGAEALRQSVEA